MGLRDPERIAALTFAVAEQAGLRLPLRLGRRLTRAYLLLRYRRMRDERQTVAENLAHVLGEPADGQLVAAATKAAFGLYGQYWFDTFALRSMPSERVLRDFRVRGIEHIDEALAAGRGAVAALPHMGNWDAAGHWLALRGYRAITVAEELRPRQVFDLFQRHRRALGMEVVPLAEGSHTAQRLATALAENSIVALIADRNLSGRGVEVVMFGARRLMPAGPALLSIASGAPLIPACVYTAADGWDCVIEAPLPVERTGSVRGDVATLTQALAGRFEAMISAAPADWHVFQPAWDAPPPAPGTGEG